MKVISIYFDNAQSFDLSTIKKINKVTGLYFIFCTKTIIQYPFDTSRLIYIGMSEKKTSSVGNRLVGHFGGLSKNVGLSNYRKRENLLFTYINYEVLQYTWQLRVEDLESYFILNFVENFGVYPICNNKTGFEVLKNDLTVNFKIDWKYFK